jgi:ABC-2 type transport system ATP-binding protein
MRKKNCFSFHAHHAGSGTICDRVIINNGKIVADKKLDHLISADKEQVIEVEFDYKIENRLLPK